MATLSGERCEPEARGGEATDELKSSRIDGSGNHEGVRGSGGSMAPLPSHVCSVATHPTKVSVFPQVTNMIR